MSRCSLASMTHFGARSIADPEKGRILAIVSHAPLINALCACVIYLPYAGNRRYNCFTLAKASNNSGQPHETLQQHPPPDQQSQQCCKGSPILRASSAPRHCIPPLDGPPSSHLGYIILPKPGRCRPAWPIGATSDKWSKSNATIGPFSGVYQCDACLAVKNSSCVPLNIISAMPMRCRLHRPVHQFRGFPLSRDAAPHCGNTRRTARLGSYGACMRSDRGHGSQVECPSSRRCWGRAWRRRAIHAGAMWGEGGEEPVCIETIVPPLPDEAMRNVVGFVIAAHPHIV